MFKLISVLRRFQKSVITKKTPVLMLLNKQLSKDSGTIVDFDINRERKTIEIELVKYGEMNVIHVAGYSVELVQGETFIRWRRVTVEGNEKAPLTRLLNKSKSALLPAYLFNLVKGVMGEPSTVSVGR